MGELRLGPLTIEPLDPSGVCDACGVTGTVAVTVLHTSPETVRRYCEPCWPAARQAFEEEREDRMMQFMRQGLRAGPFRQPEKPPASSAASRSWYDVNLFIEQYLLPADGGPGADAGTLASMARDLVRDAPKMNGPMPANIADFVAKQLVNGRGDR